MRLTSAEIDRYGPLHDCRPPCEDGLTVISGPNEAGKTLYLEAVLHLLDPSVTAIMDPGPRVDSEPAGRVLLEHAGEEYGFPGDGPLSEVTEIEPRHLQSVFVVRDNDLALPSGQDYYSSLIEKLGDIHTTEITEIKEKLKARGRLTDRRLNISSDQSVNNAGDIRDDAEALSGDIRDYTEVMADEGLDDLQARRLRVKRELARARDRHDTLQQQRLVAEYERLDARLETYRNASGQLAALERFDRDTLEELRKLDRSLEADRERLQEVQTELDEKQAKLTETEADFSEHRRAVARLERRADGVQATREALDSYRQRANQARGADERQTTARRVAAASLVGAGLSGAGGAIAGSIPGFMLAVILLIAAALGFVWHRRVTQRLTALEAAEDDVLETARDAGLEVDSVGAVAPAIESFEADLEEARTEKTRADEQVTALQSRIDDLEAEAETLEASIQSNEETLTDILDDAGVDSIEAYDDAVEDREKLESDRRAARQSLIDKFGDPEPDDPTEKITTWEADLEALVADLPVSEIDADAHDPEALEEADSEVAELEKHLQSLDTELNEHDERLRQFDRRATQLQAEPFTGQSLELKAHTREGLEALADELDALVKTIETDAEISRKALEVFNDIEAREEEKITELFDPDGPASAAFSALTGGRYSEVAYDPDTHSLAVERTDGRRFQPATLSQGTRDQLYFATRVSLAQQLLGSEPGFLLLDDPFLTADPERLHNGFETLLELADQGWQILYFTAKAEVGTTMVDEFGLRHSELDAIT